MDLMEIPIKPTSPDNGKFQEENIMKICDLIDAKRKELGGLSANKVVVGGFSQGAALALAIACRYREPLGGCVVLSGWALPKQDIAAKLKKRGDIVKGTKFCVCHGESDNVVLMECGKHVNEMLSDCDVSFQTYRYMAHSSCGEEMGDVQEFLSGCFSS
jgi:predicted esterase